MNPQKLYISTMRAVGAAILITVKCACGQQPVSTISDQPQDQLVQLGGNATLSFGVTDLLACQWMCNGAELDGQTNATLTIENVQIADAGYYSCVVATSTQIEETTAASLMVYSFGPDDDDGLVVFATPITATGNLGTCPGPYTGYVNYTKTVQEGWGWTPSTNTTVYTASDGNRTNTKVEYVGGYGDSGCAKADVTIPHPTYSPMYRFSIYFTNNVPKTNYPITLIGFNP